MLSAIEIPVFSKLKTNMLASRTVIIKDRPGRIFSPPIVRLIIEGSWGKELKTFHRGWLVGNTNRILFPS